MRPRDRRRARPIDDASVIAGDASPPKKRVARDGGAVASGCAR